MEEMEAPIENAQEDLHHHATHGGERWVLGAALSSSLLAAMAAISMLLAGHHVNEAMLEQSKANDQWGYYQAKGIKAAVVGSKIDLLTALGKPVPEKDRKKFAEYGSKQEETKKEAEDLVKSSEKHMRVHQTLANGVTMFQVAIAVAAIAVLSKRPPFWYVGLAFGIAGVYFMVRGILL